jgi:exodeoxyribonuclease VIII
MLEKIEDKIYFEREGISNSFLTRFERSPAHAFTEIEKTKSMEIGSLIHDFVLQGEIFDSKYKITPKDLQDSRKIEYKNFVKEYDGKIFIKYDDFEKAKIIKENILNFNFGFQLKNILDTAFCEIGCFVEDPEFNLLRKSKMDLYFPDCNLIVDLKKTEDCLSFKKSVINYKYYRQDAWYSENIFQEVGEWPRFIFLTFESTPPFGVMVYEVSQEWKDYGKFVNDKTLLDYTLWDGEKRAYPDGIVLLEKPDWLK